MAPSCCSIKSCKNYKSNTISLFVIPKLFFSLFTFFCVFTLSFFNELKKFKRQSDNVKQMLFLPSELTFLLEGTRGSPYIRIRIEFKN